MITMLDIDSRQMERLRAAHYNATLIEVVEVHADLRILRVRPDGGMPTFRAGQFVSVGLGYWEPRVEGAQAEQLSEEQLFKVPRRAYSISCTMLDKSGVVVAPSCWPYLEFYVALVRQAARHAPVMSPRLFALRPGGRLFVETKAVGTFTLERVSPTDDVVLLATGTGEAPHNAMTAELLAANHRGAIVSVACVRRRRDLAYLPTHRKLEKMFENYHYQALTTREPENLDPDAPGYVGKQYLQDYVASGGLQRDTGLELQPDRSHAFLCGNPAMIGLPQKQPGSNVRRPAPGGMIDVLTRRGFRADLPQEPGNLHFERYW
ncbi:MAG: ferredoxin--NADP reductase [Pirellulaceae bacterium]